MLCGDVAEEVPYAWYVSRICEEFGCLPSEAEAEIERDNERDDPLLPDILDLRQYAACKRTLDEHERLNKAIDDPTPLMKQVYLDELHLMRERQHR